MNGLPTIVASAILNERDRHDHQPRSIHARTTQRAGARRVPRRAARRRPQHPPGQRPPHTTPVWYHHEAGDNITFFTSTQGRHSRKADLVAAAGVVSLFVQQEAFPYKYVTVEGTVVGTDRPPAAGQALAIVRRYLPEEQARDFVQAELNHPASEFVVFTVRPDRWLSFDFSEASA